MTRAFWPRPATGAGAGTAGVGDASHVDGQNVTVTVYGLGTLQPGANFPGITAQELAAHQALSTLNERFTTLEAWLPASAWADPTWKPYQPAAMRLLVRNADADPPDDTGLGNQLIDWPDSSDPATFGDPNPLSEQRCGVVSGEQAQAMYAALSGANQLSRLVKDEHRYEVVVRLQLPDESDECPSAAA